MNAQLDLFTESAAAPAVEVHHITWNGIAVEVRYCPAWLGGWFGALMGHGLAHVEVRAGVPLPISKTGYRSFFNRPDNIGNQVEFVRAALEATR